MGGGRNDCPVGPDNPLIYPGPTAPTMLSLPKGVRHRLGRLRQSRRFSPFSRRLCCGRRSPERYAGKIRVLPGRAAGVYLPDVARSTNDAVRSISRLPLWTETCRRSVGFCLAMRFQRANSPTSRPALAPRSFENPRKPNNAPFRARGKWPGGGTDHLPKPRIG